MCGIAGLIGASNEYQNFFLARMIDRMVHRGPDGQGKWHSRDNKVALGHTRLAILDTSDAGAQPMHLDSHDLHLVVNGEIYNYPELRKILEKKYAIKCVSNCDSEIILHGYAQEGSAFFERMNGMFAFALVDGKSNIIHILRDRIGVKPLYLCSKDDIIAFSSEIKSLIAGFDVSEWDIDRIGLNEYLCYQTPMNGRTLFKDVRLLKPGHHMIVDLKTVSIIKDEPYWTSVQTEFSNNFTNTFKEFESSFGQSVERHLLSDLPIAATLSSGFDSAIVVAKAAQIKGKGLNTYTGAFNLDKSWYDETEAAADLTKSIFGKHHIVDIGAEDFLSHFDDLIYALDEPRMGMGAFPQYMVARHAAKNFKVILTGHGGDELFSGYPIFKLVQKNGII